MIQRSSSRAKMERNSSLECGVSRRAVVHPIVDEDVPAIQDVPRIPRDRVEDLQKELQMYMNAINSILVVAALIVSITFQGFLTPPYQDPKNPTFILDFCIYNSFSFYSAVATVIVGAGATLPSLRSPIAIAIEEEVQTVRKLVRLCSVLVALSIVGVLGAVPGPNYGSPPKLSRNVAISVIHCVGLLFCALAMTAYVLRLNWNFFGNLDGQVLKQEKPQIVSPTKRPCVKNYPSLGRVVFVVGLCGLILSFFLAFLFFLPFYAKFYGKDNSKGK